MKLAYTLCLLALLFFVTPVIDNYNYAFMSGKGMFEKDMLYKVLGDARGIFSDYSFIRADVYYHGGVRARDRGECGGIEDHSDSGHHDGEGYKKGRGRTRVSKSNMLAYIGERIKLDKHVHLHGEEERELIPWFYYAARLNPENTDAYVMGGYWLGERLKKPEEALKFLERGLRSNPSSWKIYMQLGKIHFLNYGDAEEASANFRKAKALLTEENCDKFDRRQVYTFMAACCEKAGNTDEAIALYKEILALFPDDEVIGEKIRSLSVNLKTEE